MTEAAEAEATHSPARRWAVFATVVIAMLMHSVDQTSVATALTTLQHDLGTGLAWTGWTLTVYSVGQIMILPLAGPLGERFGARGMFLGGIIGFTLASILCAVSPGMPVLILGRLLQGLTGGMLMPLGTAIVADTFGHDRDRAIALFTTVFPFGAILGPLAGGLILTLASWRWIFLINVPIGVVLIGAGLVLIRPTPRSDVARIDTVGVVVLAVVLLSGMVAITQLAHVGEGVPALLSVVVAGSTVVAAGLVLARHIRRHPSPVIPPRLLKGGSLGVLNLMNVLFGAAVLGFSALVPHYAQVRYGLAPLAAGGLLTARAVLMIAGSAIAVTLLRRLGHKPILLAGMSVIAVALILTALQPLGTTAEIWLVLASAVLGAGMGFAAPAASNAGLHLAPDKAASVSGLRVMFRQTGSIFAVSVITATASASTDEAGTDSWAFLALALVMTVAIAATSRIPNQRGRW